MMWGWLILLRIVTYEQAYLVFCFWMGRWVLWWNWYGFFSLQRFPWRLCVGLGSRFRRPLCLSLIRFCIFSRVGICLPPAFFYYSILFITVTVCLSHPSQLPPQSIYYSLYLNMIHLLIILRVLLWRDYLKFIQDLFLDEFPLRSALGRAVYRHRASSLYELFGFYMTNIVFCIGRNHIPHKLELLNHHLNITIFRAEPRRLQNLTNNLFPFLPTSNHLLCFFPRLVV